jgi:hypothetical protein
MEPLLIGTKACEFHWEFFNWDNLSRTWSHESLLPERIERNRNGGYETLLRELLP